MKRIALVALTVLCTTFAFAGGSRAPSSAGTTAAKTPLTYLAWNLGTAEENNVERQMLTAFAAANPTVALTVLEVPMNADGTNGNYSDYLTTLASQSNLPDVFMQTSVPDYTAKGWVLNVSNYAAGDSDYQNVMPALRQGAEINGHVYGIPFAVHFYGIAVNLSILEELNVEPLPFNYTVDQLRDQIAATTTSKYKGVDNFALEDWGAFTVDPAQGYATFDGKAYHFTGEAFAKAIGIYQDIVSRGQTGNGGIVPATSWLPEGVGWPWGEGYIANQYEATWSLGDFVSGARPFKADLMPLPGEKIVLVPDFIFVSANTKSPELAYNLAKWMGYGKDGQLKRVDIAKAAGLTLSSLPLAPGKYAAVDTFYLQNYRSLSYFTQTYQMLQQKPENAIVESYKVVPGFELSRFNADTGVLGTVDGAQKSLTMGQLLTSIIRGDHQLADYAAEMERIANAEYQKAATALQGK